MCGHCLETHRSSFPMLCTYENKSHISVQADQTEGDIIYHKHGKTMVSWVSEAITFIYRKVRINTQRVI